MFKIDEHVAASVAGKEKQMSSANDVDYCQESRLMRIFSLTMRV
jgi:hypothetical protein